MLLSSFPADWFSGRAEKAEAGPQRLNSRLGWKAGHLCSSSQECFPPVLLTFMDSEVVKDSKTLRKVASLPGQIEGYGTALFTPSWEG